MIWMLSFVGRINHRPEEYTAWAMIFVACDNLPIRESSSCFLAAFLDDQDANRWHNSTSLSSGRCISNAIVSMSTLRKTISVASPSTFSSLSGRPSTPQQGFVTCRLFVHSLDAREPVNKNSSEYCIRSVTPSCSRIHSKASATALNIFKEDEWEDCIHVYLALPRHSQIFSVCWVDRNVAEGVLYVHFC